MLSWEVPLVQAACWLQYAKDFCVMDRPNSLEWTPDEIARFWDYWSARSDSQDTYFALQVGNGVTRLAEFVRPLAGASVLDFGSGPGHLIAHLLERDAIVSAVDHSPNSISEVEKRFAGQAGWCEAKTFEDRRLPWAAESFDVAFCLETIEHLHTEDCSRIFDEIFRVLRPNGYAVITTPNSEDLAKQQVYCPCCNSEFHRWQHLRSWSAEQLSDRLGKHGFEVSFCQGLNFEFLQPRKRRVKWRAALKDGLRRTVASARDRFTQPAFPTQAMLRHYLRKGNPVNLAAVAFKPAESGSVVDEDTAKRAA